MPSRENVSAERLLEILSQELARREECAGCAIAGGVTRLAEPYPDGGNWSRSIAIRGRPGNPQAAGEAAVEVVVFVAELFNLA